MSSSQKPLKLGVLLVHGIGEQPKGDTLLRFGGPIIQWMDRWAHGSVDHTSFQLVGSKIGASNAQDDERKYVIASLKDAAGAESQICFLESWWADKFTPPTFGSLAWWMLTVGVWSIMSHGGRSLRQSTGLSMRLRGALLFLGSIPISFVVLAVVSALALLAVIPIAPLRNQLSKLLLILTRTLGDSYVLINSPIQRVAVVEKVNDDIAWLADRCDKVAIVAHSQGAAIAFEALTSIPPRDEVEGLLTAGSGQAKLEELKLIDESIKWRGGFRGWSLLFPFLPVSMVALIGFGLNLFQSDEIFGSEGIMILSFSLIYLSPLIFAAWVAFKGWPALENVLSGLPKKLSEKIVWVDYYASHDPVPNGALFAEESATRRSAPVVNQMSTLADHNTYFSNWTDFLPRVVHFLNQVGNLGMLNAQGDTRIGKFIAKRRIQLKFITLTIWLCLAYLVSGLCFVFLGDVNPVLDGLIENGSWLAQLIPSLLAVIPGIMTKIPLIGDLSDWTWVDASSSQQVMAIVFLVQFGWFYFLMRSFIGRVTDKLATNFLFESVRFSDAFSFEFLINWLHSFLLLFAPVMICFPLFGLLFTYLSMYFAPLVATIGLIVMLALVCYLYLGKELRQFFQVFN